MTAVAAASVTVPVELPAIPYVADHCIEGRAIVPAVELLELLVKTAAHRKGWKPLPLPFAMRDVSFPRFLAVEELPRCTFTVDVREVEDGVRMALTSHIGLPNGMRRSRVHVEATLGPATRTQPERPADVTCDYHVAAEQVYRELVRFGPRFRNLRDILDLGPAGALGTVRSPEPPAAAHLAGCPFLLDAAMHLACVWGQRYAGAVAYPTGFAERWLLEPTPAGERRCLAIPTSVEAKRLAFDVWLSEADGRLCDVVRGLTMAPIAGGVSPPDWIKVEQPPA